MFMSFLNSLLRTLYSSMVIHHEQCIVFIYDSAARERNNFQQLSKLIELKFHNLASHYLTFTSKVTHQRVITCPKLFLNTKNIKLYINLAPYLFIMKSLLNADLYLKCFHFTCCLLG